MPFEHSLLNILLLLEVTSFSLMNQFISQPPDVLQAILHFLWLPPLLWLCMRILIRRTTRWTRSPRWASALNWMLIKSLYISHHQQWAFFLSSPTSINLNSQNRYLQMCQRLPSDSKDGGSLQTKFIFTELNFKKYLCISYIPLAQLPTTKTKQNPKTKTIFW